MNLRSLAAVILLPAGLAACGSTSTPGPTSTTSSPSPTASSPPVASPSPSAVVAPAGTAVTTTAAAMVAGKSEVILTDTRGLTLYYRTSDTPTNVCSGGCASAWPPLLLAQGTPASSTSVPGALAVLDDANGRQVTYNGHPLYRFASDVGPGDTRGNGIAGVWFVQAP